MSGCALHLVRPSRVYLYNLKLFTSVLFSLILLQLFRALLLIRFTVDYLSLYIIYTILYVYKCVCAFSTSIIKQFLAMLLLLRQLLLLFSPTLVATVVVLPLVAVVSVPTRRVACSADAPLGYNVRLTFERAYFISFINLKMQFKNVSSCIQDILWLCCTCKRWREIIVNCCES